MKEAIKPATMAMMTIAAVGNSSPPLSELERPPVVIGFPSSPTEGTICVAGGMYGPVSLADPESVAAMRESHCQLDPGAVFRPCDGAATTLSLFCTKHSGSSRSLSLPSRGSSPDTAWVVHSH